MQEDKRILLYIFLFMEARRYFDLNIIWIPK